MSGIDLIKKIREKDTTFKLKIILISAFIKSMRASNVDAAIYYLARMVEAGEDPPVVLIDPVIVERDGKIRGEEGCLSIPEIFGDVDRSAEIVVETTSLEGQRMRIAASDLCSRAIQHEIDHLDGILFLDHLSPLKRHMLMKKWKKLRKGKTGYLKEVALAGGKG